MQSKSNTLKNLSDCEGLLKRELRFSAYDRAKALYAFAQRAQEMVKASCKVAKLADSDCDTTQLSDFESRIATSFNLTTNPEKAKPDSKDLNQKIEMQLKLQ